MKLSDVTFMLDVAGDASLDVVRFELIEGLSRPFRLELDLSAARSDIDADRLLDTETTFTLLRDGEPVRTVTGIVTAFELGESGFRRTRYRAVVEPELVRLDLWHGSRIHQQCSIPEIIQARLRERNLHARLTASRPHDAREYSVQHRETDLDFVSRLAAEEGFVYYFDAGEQSRLTFVDVLQTSPTLKENDDIGVVHYQPNPGGDACQPHLWHFAVRRQLAPARATRRDRTFKNPDYQLEQTYSSRNGVGYEHFDHPGRYKRDEVGRAFVRTALRQLRSDATIATLEGDDARVWPGLAFLLSGHGNEALDRDWRVIAMHHRGVQSIAEEEESADAQDGTRYSYTAQAVPGDMEWRPAPLPRPIVDGLQVAHVVGPEGEQLHTDDTARVMVWFPWDRAGERDGATAWLRVSQLWAGAGYGAVFVPRVGQEVLVAYVDGDPDQPVVVGRLYNAAKRPPYALPNLKTLSAIRSEEHKGSGYNELLIDDTSGELATQLRSTHAATQLTLGYLTHRRGADGRGTPRGEGFELRTDAAGALRAACGLLVTTYERSRANGRQLDQQEMGDCLRALAEMSNTLLDVAAQNHAMPSGHDARDALSQAIEKLGAGANDRPKEEGARSIIGLSAPDGIAAATPKTVLLGAGENVEAIAQRNACVTAAERIHLASGKGLSQFAVDGGIVQIAHRGDVDVQAQHGHLRHAAQQDVQANAGGDIVHTARGRVVLQTEAGAALVLEGRKATLYADVFQVHANVEADGPQSLAGAVNEWPQASFDDRYVVRDEDTGEALADVIVQLMRADGSVLRLTTDAQGRLPMQQSTWTEPVSLQVLGRRATTGEGE